MDCSRCGQSVAEIGRRYVLGLAKTPGCENGHEFDAVDPWRSDPRTVALLEACEALLAFAVSVRPGGRVLKTDPDFDDIRAAIALAKGGE